MAIANDLKALQTKQKDLDEQKLFILRKIVELQEQQNKIHRQYDAVTKQIENITKNFTVTEHALLRYIEKTYNIDLNETSKTILESESLKRYDTIGNGEYPINNGLKAVVKDKIIITIKGKK